MRAKVRAPSAASLPNDLRIPSSIPAVVKAFSRLSRQSLLDLALSWLDGNGSSSKYCQPYLERDQIRDNNNDSSGSSSSSPYAAAKTVQDARRVYEDFQDRKGGKKEVVERMLDGDWRHGVTLRQLALVDMRYLTDHPLSLRWAALELTRLSPASDKQAAVETAPTASTAIPSVHMATFVEALQREISPLVKAHYHVAHASSSLPLVFVRILVIDSPYQIPRLSAETILDSSRVVYVAFPSSCPYVYTSIAGSSTPVATPTGSNATATDARTLRRIVAEAIPKALSQPHQRLALRPTSLTARSLHALLALRGPGRAKGAPGAFSIFADAVVEGSPLDPRPPESVLPDDYLENSLEKRVGAAAATTTTTTTSSSSSSSTTTTAYATAAAIDSRFGTTGTTGTTSAPLDRLDIRLLDPPAATSNLPPAAPTLSLAFSGADVFRGIRALAELGAVDPVRMPSWMTGEEAVSVALVRNGRVVRDG